MSNWYGQEGYDWQEMLCKWFILLGVLSITALAGLGVFFLWKVVARL